MDYSQINSFLEKFKSTIFKKEDLYKDIIDSVFEDTGVSLSIKDIKIKNNEIKIKTSPIIKNEILIKKDNILKILLKKQPLNRFTNIN